MTWRYAHLFPVRQLWRFVVSGLLVAGSAFATMTILVTLVAIPSQIALVVAYLVAVCVHFLLSRQFVYATEGGYAIRRTGQGVRYLTFVGLSYLLTALALAIFPAWLDVSELLVYYATAIILAMVTFLVLRSWVFRSRHGQEASGGPNAQA